MKDYVIINGVSSKTKTGLAINILPPITKPEMRTLVEEIDGRDGDIITKLGYSAYDKTIEIGLFGNGYDVDDIIAFFNKEGTIVFSNEPTKYYNFTLVDSFDIERLLQFKTSTITFHCQPFKYEVGETPKEIEYDYVNGEGTEITLDNTMNALMELELNPSELTQETRQYITVEWEQGEVAGSTGQDVPNDNSIRTKGYTRVYPGVLYKMSRTLSTRAMNFRFYDISYNYIGSQAVEDIVTTNKATNRMEIGDASIDLTINNTSVAYMRMVDYTNDLSIVYTIYTDNTPSPSYPQEVQVIKGNNSVIVENKNLFKESQILNATGWALNSDGYYYGTFTNYHLAFQNGFTFNAKFKENTQYTCSVNAYCSGGSSGIYFEYTDGTQESLRINNTTASDLTFTTAENKTLSKVIGTYGSGGSNTLYLKNLQLEEGLTATSYVAHQEQVLSLNLPVDNLFNKNDITSSNGYISDANGNFISNSSQPTKASNYINVRGINKIHFSTNMTVNRWGAFYDENQTFISGISWYNNNPVTVPSNAYYMRATVQISILDEFQIEPGEVENQYTPFGTTPIEYCKIGDYEDEFEHDGDKWYLNKNIGKVVLDGSETGWGKQAGVNGNYYKIENIISAKINTTYTTGRLICSHFVESTSGSYDGSKNKFWATNNGLSLRFGGVEQTDVDTWKTWLANNNVTVYYQLETPTHDEITDTTLINQLNAIEKAVSYDEQTNISQTNTQLPFRIKATAILSGSDSVEITNNGNVYAKPILDIKGTGIINVYLNGTQMFSVDITDEIIVDIPNLETYNPNTSALMNRNVTGNISNFIIPVGTNTITVDGAVEKVTITMYQRWL